MRPKITCSVRAEGARPGYFTAHSRYLHYGPLGAGEGKRYRHRRKLRYGVVLPQLFCSAEPAKPYNKAALYSLRAGHHRASCRMLLGVSTLYPEAGRSGARRRSCGHNVVIYRSHIFRHGPWPFGNGNPCWLTPDLERSRFICRNPHPPARQAANCVAFASVIGRLSLWFMDKRPSFAVKASSMTVRRVCQLINRLPVARYPLSAGGIFRPV